MLIRMMPGQISDHWDVIKYAIENSLPPIAGGGSDRMNNILSALMSGGMHCWASYRVETENGADLRLEAVLVTTIAEDMCSGIDSLLVYCLYGFGSVDSNEAWMEGFSTLSKFARSAGCSRIIGYTDSERVKGVVKRLGGDAKYTFVSLPI